MKNKDKEKIKFRVEFEPTPIRHFAVQCPKCKNWFHGSDVVSDSLYPHYGHELHFANFKCPVCEKSFGGYLDNAEIDIQESVYPDVYDGCLEKKVEWV